MPDASSLVLSATSVGSGVIAALSAAPFISLVDKAITSNASGRQSLWASMRESLGLLVSQPALFARQRSFRWIVAVYSATYVAANLTHQWLDQAKRPWQTPKFMVASTVNVSMSVLKDRAFAKIFASADATPPRAFPKISMGLFAIRDAGTILASFNLPAVITPIVQREFDIGRVPARTAVQLVTPLAMQVFSVPLHLWGLDCYNHPVSTTKERIAFVKSEYLKTVVARWMRILPAFSIAGVVNTELLERSRKSLNIST